MKQKTRDIKVYEAPGMNIGIPQIRLQGKWLSDLGFHIGDQIHITCNQGKLIIESAPNDSTKSDS